MPISSTRKTPIHLDAGRYADGPVLRRPDLHRRRLEAFLEDDENSLLFIARTNNGELIEELMGQEIIFYENYYCVAFEKF